MQRLLLNRTFNNNLTRLLAHRQPFRSAQSWGREERRKRLPSLPRALLPVDMLTSSPPPAPIAVPLLARRSAVRASSVAFLAASQSPAKREVPNQGVESASASQSSLAAEERHGGHTERVLGASLPVVEGQPATPEKREPSTRALRVARKPFIFVWNCILWLGRLLRLTVYVAFLLPGFVQMFFWYYSSKRITKSVRYGENRRNFLDTYRPPGAEKGPAEEGKPLLPVVIYVTGGAWTVGHRAWGSLLGRRLSEQGCIVCSLDYRNYPKGDVLDMLEDTNAGVAWVTTHARELGGDPEKVFLVGQSCGGQMTALALTLQAEQESTGGEIEGGRPRWSPASLAGVVGVSGVYNPFDLENHFHYRGFSRGYLRKLMKVKEDVELKLRSPSYCVVGEKWGDRLPPTLLLHGTADNCAQPWNAVQYQQVLIEAGAAATLKLYHGATHTSPLIEDPMRGGSDPLLNDLMEFVLQKEVVHLRQTTLCPGFMVSIAGWVCPF